MQTDATLPPAELNTSESPDYFILVQLKVPPIPGFNPEGSRVGTLIMGHLIEARLQCGGVQVEGPGGSGDFNGSVYLLKVKHLAPALDSIKATFASVALLNCVEIAWFDGREDILRIEHPVRDTRPYPFDMLEIKSKETKQFVQDFVSFANQLLEEIKKRNG